MTLTNTLLLCAVVFMVGLFVGQTIQQRQCNQVIEHYKDVIEEYRKSLIGSR